MAPAKGRARPRPTPLPPEPWPRPGRPDPEWASVRPCAICRREARHFGYVHQLRTDLYPTYRFCSLRCQNAGAALARRHNGMIDKTDMEQQAIKDARRPFAEILTELGLMEHFLDLSADQIDRLIEAAIDGFQESMQRQALNDRSALLSARTCKPSST